MGEWVGGWVRSMCYLLVLRLGVDVGWDEMGRGLWENEMWMIGLYSRWLGGGTMIDIV